MDSVSEAQDYSYLDCPIFGPGCLPTWDMSIDAFRLCFCPVPCGRLFFICPSCDREQIYCSKSCSETKATINHRAANKRYQQSPKGKRNNAARQDRFRRNKRLSQSSPAPAELAQADHAQNEEKIVTDITYANQAEGATMQSCKFVAPELVRRPRVVLICRFCGRRGSYINPFSERRRN